MNKFTPLIVILMIAIMLIAVVISVVRIFSSQDAKLIESKIELENNQELNLPDQINIK